MIRQPIRKNLTLEPEDAAGATNGQKASTVLGRLHGDLSVLLAD